jgi:hypothetical protein
MDPDTLPAGRELDTLVSRAVMGGDVYPDGGGYYDFMERVGSGQSRSLPYYSTDIRAAWEVVNKVLSTDGHFAFWPSIRGFGIAYHGIRTWDSEPVWEVFADTAPLAICRAALKAVMAAQTKEER